MKPYPTFSTRLAFILVTAGAAIGLGNIWGFTYVAGKNGGGGFVLIYLLALVFIATPVFMAELALGRLGRAHPPEAMNKLQKAYGSPRLIRLRWAWPAWGGVICTLLILSFYSVIAGQAMQYGWVALGGGFEGWSETEIRALDTAFKSGVGPGLIWGGLFMAGTAFIVATDIRLGIERAGRYLMPLLFVFLIFLVIYAALQGDFVGALNFMFGFQDMVLNGTVILEAVGQAFFTVSVGVGAIMLYGSYMGEDVNLARATLWIVGMDLFVALMAGFAIFPLVFASGISPSAGPGLVYLTLPTIFGSLPYGGLAALIFFLLLTFAAITSSISLLSPSVAFLETKGMSRQRAAWVAALFVLLLSSLTVLSFTHWRDFYPLAAMGFEGLTFFELIREGVNNIFLPIAGLAYAVMIGWALPRNTVRQAFSLEKGWMFTLWYGSLRYVVPLGIIGLFIAAFFKH